MMQLSFKVWAEIENHLYISLSFNQDEDTETDLNLALWQELRIECVWCTMGEKDVGDLLTAERCEEIWISYSNLAGPAGE